MCIVINKPKNVEIPSLSILEMCAANNSDGMGFMIAMGNRVDIKKGFKTAKSMRHYIMHSYPNNKIKTVIFHFRIATHGDKIPQNTHPFPLSDKILDLQSLSMSCEIGMAHNGVFSWSADSKSDLSDTQLAIQSTLFRYTWEDLNNLKISSLLEHILHGSHVVFLHKSGRVWANGEGWNENNKVLYSNTSWKTKSYLHNYNMYPHNYGYGYGDAERFDYKTGKWHYENNSDKYFNNIAYNEDDFKNKKALALIDKEKENKENIINITAKTCSMCLEDNPDLLLTINETIICEKCCDFISPTNILSSSTNIIGE